LINNNEEFVLRPAKVKVVKLKQKSDKNNISEETKE
jgi:hypothetical protein